MMEAQDIEAPVAPRSPGKYRVLAVEPDKRLRTRITIELAGITPSPAATVEDTLALLDSEQPTVLLLGPSFADDHGWAQAHRLTRGLPHVSAVLLADEITLTVLQEGMRVGVRDAVLLNAGEGQIRQTIERVGDALVDIANRAAGLERNTGRLLVSFSTKGGVGKSVVSTNLAVGLALEHRDRVVIVDADLQFGDVAVMLGVKPVSTTIEAAGAVSSADAQLMDGLLAVHEPSSLRVLCAPIEPSGSDSITPQAMLDIVALLRTMFDYVVVDMPPHFDDTVLAVIEEADDVLLVASMDIPSIKNLKVGMQTLDLLAVDESKLRLVLNRANAKVNLDVADVEKVLGVRASFRVPSDIAVPQAVNRGVPIVMHRPRSPAGEALRALAHEFGQTGTSSHDEVQNKSPRRRAWRRSA
jgi:pilus assembly protein CpaE